MPLAINQANQVPQETQEAYLQTSGWREKAQKMQESGAKRRVEVAEQQAEAMKAEAQEKQKGAQGASTATAVAGTLGGVAGTLALLGVGAEASVVGIPVGLALQAVAALSLVAAGICGIFAGTKTGNAQESLAGADKIVKTAGNSLEQADNDQTSLLEKIKADKTARAPQEKGQDAQIQGNTPASSEVTPSAQTTIEASANTSTPLSVSAAASTAPSPTPASTPAPAAIAAA